MDLTEAETNLLKVAATLGALQGIVWFGLSLACVILYNVGIEYAIGWTTSTYMEWLERALYEWYLNKDSISVFMNFDLIVVPDTFTIIMWIYLFLNLGWFLFSLFLYADIAKNYRIVNALVAWGIMTIFILILDVVTSVLLGIDYNTCLTNSTDNFDQQMIFTNLIIPVLVIAGKGYVLWIVDLILVIIVFRISREYKARVAAGDGLWRDRRIPRATLQQNPNYYGQQAPYQAYMENPNNLQAPPHGNPWSANPKGYSDPMRSPPRSPAYINQQQQQMYNPQYR